MKKIKNKKNFLVYGIVLVMTVLSVACGNTDTVLESGSPEVVNEEQEENISEVSADDNEDNFSEAVTGNEEIMAPELPEEQENKSDISAPEVEQEEERVEFEHKEVQEGSVAPEPAADQSDDVTEVGAIEEVSSTVVETVEEVSSAEPETKESEGFSISEISDELFERMKKGNTYKEDCIIPREDLRYLTALHKDIDGNIHQGEMVVHKLIAEDVLEILEKFYEADYPIERMVLPDDYMADDETMMRDNNSSCFNFRFMSHSKRISKHGLGMAVDINTLYNPYHKIVKNEDGTTEDVVEPATGAPYLDRTRDFDYKINRGDLCYQLFTEKGFVWGGDWTSVKDYQHFELPTAITEKYSEAYLKENN